MSNLNPFVYRASVNSYDPISGLSYEFYVDRTLRVEWDTVPAGDGDEIIFKKISMDTGDVLYTAGGDDSALLTWFAIFDPVTIRGHEFDAITDQIERALEKDLIARRLAEAGIVYRDYSEDFELIFDNGGGITLMTASYCHFFEGPRGTDAAQAASCVHELMNGEDPEGWDGDEPEHRMEYDVNDELNGFYNWRSQDDVEAALVEIRATEIDTWRETCGRGFAEQEFFEALHELRLSDNA